MKRGRGPSPFDDRHAQPPPYGKRERYASPPREREREREKYERREYSPPRDEGPRFARENNYRPAVRDRTRSPVRRSEHVSHMGSPVSSRRSSPHIHPTRVVMAGSGTHSPAMRHHRPVPAQQSPPVYRDRSPPPRRGYISPVPMSPPEETLAYRQRSPPRRRESPPPPERKDFRNGSTPNTWSKDQISAPQGPAYHNGEYRGPPSGPSRGHYNGPHPRDSPSGPPAAPISMSAHNRPSSASLLSAPTRPRGGPSFGRDGRDGRGDGPYGGPPPRRGPPQHSPYHGPPPRHQGYDHGPAHGPPHGHRNDPPPHHSSRPPPFEHRPPFRTNNSSSTTYPRTQRFPTHLSGMPSVVPGGKAAPSGMDPTAEKRLQQLEEDKKRLLDAIEEKQKAKRAGLREWERAERESTRDGLKSELAEEALERMQGEGAGSANAF